MNLIEETIEATLDSHGQLRLTHPPQMLPGPVRVTIRAGASGGPRRGLADVIREIAGEQRFCGFPVRSAAMCIQSRLFTAEPGEIDAPFSPPFSMAARVRRSSSPRVRSPP